MNCFSEFMHKAKTVLRRCTSRPGPVNHQDVVKLLKQIIMTQAELAAGLKTIQTQVGKVAKEQSDRFDALTAKIKELTDIINAGGDVTPEVTEALASVQTALNELDSTIPDAPPV
jgi:predicted XRE-type DNA-binding protein